MGYSRIFSEFIQNASFESLPIDVQQSAKCFILDILGVIYSGSKSEPGKIIESFIKKSNSQAESTIIPTGFRASCLDAALVNGTFANGVSLNDMHSLSSSHPGPVVIPAVLSLAEKLGSSGSDIITAVIVGYEIMGRIGKSINPSHIERGFHPTATCGVFGAAAAASKLLNLNIDETIWALGNAGTQASGLYAFLDDGAMSLTIHPGISARNGIFAALIAKEGFRGAEYILESKTGGFLKTMADNYSKENLFEGLGKDYEILNTGFKPYACCRIIHSSIDAILNIFADNGERIKPENIEEVIVNSSPAAAKLADYNPKTFVAARMSLPFSLAQLLFSGKPSVAGISNEVLNDENLRLISKKIKIVNSPDISKYASEVEIKINSGKKYSNKVEVPRGDPGNPLKFDEIVEKFKLLAGAYHSDETWMQNVVSAVIGLEKITNASDFINILIKK